MVAQTVRRGSRQSLEVIRDGGFFDKGRYVEEKAGRFTIRGNVQPAPSQSIQRLPEGSRKEGAIALFTLAELRTAKAGDGGHNADRVVFCDREYEIATVEIWPRHRRYVATRFGQ
jgi:hypothetical protein